MLPPPRFIMAAIFANSFPTLGLITITIRSQMDTRLTHNFEGEMKTVAQSGNELHVETRHYSNVISYTLKGIFPLEEIDIKFPCEIHVSSVLETNTLVSK